MGYWPIVYGLLRKCDILLFILDVRMPELSRNRTLEKVIESKRKKVIYVFNKIDLVSKDYLEDIKSRHHGFFVSGSRNIGISDLRRNLWIIASRMKLNEPRIGVVGYPNVGKSAVINALARSAKAKVSKHAGTTKGVQWIKAGGLSILDSPGVIPFQDKETVLGVMGAKDSEKLKDALKSAFEVIKLIIEYDKSILEKAYDIKISNQEPYEILMEIGKKKGFLLKGGKTDENRAAFFVIKDWKEGKLRL